MRNTFFSFSVFFAFVAVSASACSSEHGAGEACEHIGAGSGECKSGLVCAVAASNTPGLACMPVCLHDTDCLGDQECNGVEGTNVKACRFKH